MGMKRSGEKISDTRRKLGKSEAVAARERFLGQSCTVEPTCKVHKCKVFFGYKVNF